MGGRQYYVYVCPECGGQCGELTAGHFGGCSLQTKMFAPDHVVTVPEARLSVVEAQRDKAIEALREIVRLDDGDVDPGWIAGPDYYGAVAVCAHTARKALSELDTGPSYRR